MSSLLTTGFGISTTLEDPGCSLLRLFGNTSGVRCGLSNFAADVMVSESSSLLALLVVGVSFSEVDAMPVIERVGGCGVLAFSVSFCFSFSLSLG